MTPLNKDQRYREIITRLCDGLHEERINTVIEGPIEQVVERYEFSTKPIISFSGFVEETTRFIQHLYAHETFIKQHLTTTQAKSEALLLLNNYQGLHGNGINAAWIDVKHQYRGNISPALLQLKEIIKLQQRAQYIQWILDSHLKALTWQERCRVVQILISDMNEYLSLTITGCEPEQFVDQIPSLIQMQLNSSAQIKKILKK